MNETKLDGKNVLNVVNVVVFTSIQFTMPPLDLVVRMGMGLCGTRVIHVMLTFF